MCCFDDKKAIERKLFKKWHDFVQLSTRAYIIISFFKQHLRASCSRKTCVHNRFFLTFSFNTSAFVSNQTSRAESVCCVADTRHVCVQSLTLHMSSEFRPKQEKKVKKQNDNITKRFKFLTTWNHWIILIYIFPPHRRLIRVWFILFRLEYRKTNE